MATGAPSARGRSSRAAYPTLRSTSKKLFGREAGAPIQCRCCVGWGGEWSHPLFFSSRNKRWLDFARHDSLIYPDTPTVKTL